MSSSATPPSSPQSKEGLLEYYKVQLEHRRHTEIQRSTIAGLALAASGAIICELMEHPVLLRQQLPYTVALVFVGGFGWIMTAKLYERFRLHQEVAKLARDALNPELATFRRQAEKTNKERHPLMFRMPLHVLWNVIFFLIFLLGLVTTLICLRR